MMHVPEVRASLCTRIMLPVATHLASPRKAPRVRCVRILPGPPGHDSIIFMSQAGCSRGPGNVEIPGDETVDPGTDNGRSSTGPSVRAV